MFKNNYLSILLHVGFCVLLTACGGGGSGGGGNDNRLPMEPDDETSQAVFQITASAGSGGEISPSSQAVDVNESATFELAPEPGFRIADVSGCGGVLSGATYTTGPVTADCTVQAEFAPEERYPVQGTVTGLEGVLQLQLQVGEATEQLELVAEGGEREFVFETQAYPGQAYEVQILDEPEASECNIDNGFGEMEAGGAEPVLIECVPVATTATLSGQITPAANIDVDSDTNDRRAPLVDNSTPSVAQPLNRRATLHGFAAADPTGGDEREEWFANSEDPNDFFRVSLDAGQLVQLQVVDHPDLDVGSQHQGDLDLFLYTANGEFVAHSDSVTEFEQIATPEDGEYLVRVFAYSGISKYVLRFSAVTDGAVEEVTTQSDFVPDELIVKWSPRADVAQMRTALSAVHLKMANQDTARATLVKVERPQAVDLHSGDADSGDNSPGSSAKHSDDKDALASGSSNKNAAQSAAERADSQLQRLNAGGYAKTQTLRYIKQLRLRSDVIYAEPNYIRQSYLEPADPGYRYQWHYGAISLPQAWDRVAEAARYEPIVAVIDSGVLIDHPDLASRLVDGYDFIRSPTSARDGDGIDPNADDPGDSDVRGQSSWHGTHVAGTVGAAANNGRGVVGVAWNSRIMPIRVLGQGGATSYDVVQGLRYAAGLPNDSGTVPAQVADIANLSLGGDSGSLAERDAYEEARAAGLIIVAAAGNEGRSQPSYPAGYGSVISVSATDYLEQPAPYSNFGTTIAVAAPGGYMAADSNGDGYPDGVLSTLVDDSNGTREPTYSFYHGTSMAAPHVAGVLALMKSVYPELDSAAVTNLLESGAITDDRGDPGRDDQYGFGIINAFKAVNAAEELARGEEPPEVPARLVVNPDTLYLGYGARAEVEVSNEGGADPQIVAVDTDVEWLFVASSETDSAGLGRYTLTVDRTGLEDGAYRGNVAFTADDGSVVSVRVYIQVGVVSTEATLTQLYVLLMEAEGSAVVDVVLAEPATEGLVYTFTDVPLGHYRIMAGSDIDVDDFICQSGESCGAYPTLDRQQPVQVDGSDQTDLDFVANILGSFPETATAVEDLGPLFVPHERLPAVKQTTPTKNPAAGNGDLSPSSVQTSAGVASDDTQTDTRPRHDIQLPN